MEKRLLALIFILSAAILAAAPIGAQTEDPLRYDAKAYAEANGITIDEAIRRLSQQATLGEAAHLMEVTEADTFCGFWIQHQPYYAVISAFTTDPAVSREVVAKYFPGTTMEIRQYEFTLEALWEIRLSLESSLRTLGVEYSSGFDITQNGIRIMVPDIPAFMEILRLNGIILHPNVDVVEGRIVLGTIPAHGTGFYFAAAAIIAVPFVIVALFIVRSRRRRD